MALSEVDLQDIFDFLRIKVRQSGLSDVDLRIMSNFRPSESAFRDVIYYLKSLTGVARVSSKEQYRETLERLRRYVNTEEKRSVTGIEVELTPAEREQFRVDKIDLSLAPALTNLITELESIMQSVHEEIDNPRRDRPLQ